MSILRARMLVLGLGLAATGCTKSGTSPDPVEAQQAGLNVLVFGDWAFSATPSTDVGQDQLRVAQAMIAECASIGCDVALTVGDNFYPRGVTSTSDAQWEARFEDVYFPQGAPTLGAVVRPILGDKDKNGNIQAQYDYSSVSANWDMPSRYYTFSEGEVDFFAVDNLDLDVEQLAWLAQVLSESRARWKVVYGHNPIYSNVVFRDGRSGYVNRESVQALLPLLCKHADLYLAGSSHHGEVLLTECGLHLVVQGGGGAGLLDINTEGERNLFGAKTFGFTVLAFGEDEMEIRMHNDANEMLYTMSLPARSAQ